jgi:uncharacterized membrane protein YkoI
METGMKSRRLMIGLAVGASVLVGGGLTASAHSSASRTNGESFFQSVHSRASDLLDRESAAPGTIDDGKELLPQATISLDDAIAAAQAAQTGNLGEVDLEFYNGTLVFNVDIGNHDVKVDAASGTVLGSGVD